MNKAQYRQVRPLLDETVQRQKSKTVRTQDTLGSLPDCDVELL